MRHPRLDATQRRANEHLGAAEGQPVTVIEYFHPRLEEISDVLPRRLGAWLMSSRMMSRLLKPLFSSGRNVRTSGIAGFMLLRMLAGMKRWRRASYRYAWQWQHIGGWLGRIDVALADDYDRALQFARARHCQCTDCKRWD